LLVCSDVESEHKRELLELEENIIMGDLPKFEKRLLQNKKNVLQSKIKRYLTQKEKKSLLKSL